MVGNSRPIHAIITQQAVENQNDKLPPLGQSCLAYAS